MRNHFIKKTAAVKKLLTLLLTFCAVAPALRLFDDGRHDDEEAGDGVYAGRSADNLARGDYFVEVTANAATATGFVSFGR